jgi:hypothetical protein
MRGNPHDLTITPSGTRALVRTTRGAYLFDIASTPATPQFAAIDKDETLTSTHTYYLAGMDSVAATDERALIVARSSTQSTVRFYDISNDTLAVAGQSTLPDRTLDVAISPDRHWAAVAGSSYVQVYDFTTLQLAYSHDPVSGEGWFPWCDGVELDNDHLIACGYWDSQGGWLEIVDLFSQPSSYCTAGTNSTGVGATLHATGSGSIARNDLQLVCVDVPPAAPGFFVYATQQLSVPFGPGFVCVGGQRYKMPLAVASTGGIATQAADYNGTNALGGAITAGTTWNFQYRYRDVPAGGVLNLSDALSIAFTP